MKLKKLKKVDEYTVEQCAASRCRQEPDMVYGADTALGKQAGGREVPLCDLHNAKWGNEEEVQAPSVAAAAPATEPEVIPAGEAPPAQSGEMVPFHEQAALVQETKDAEEALEEIREFEIVAQEDYDFANELLGSAKAEWKKLDARKKKGTAGMLASLKEVRSWFKPAMEFYAEAEKLLKDKLAEAHRKATEAQDAALKAVEQAHAAGDAPAVRAALVESSEAEIEQAANVTVTELWDFEVTDPAAVPREYLTPDLQKIQGVVRILKQDTNIQGVRAFSKDSVTRRGA